MMTEVSDVQDWQQAAVELGDLNEALRWLRGHDGFGADTAAALVDFADPLMQSDPTTALRALELSEHVAAETAAVHVVPAAMYLRARLRLNEGHPDEALDLIAGSRTRWTELGRPLDAFRTELGRMHVLDDLGRHGEAAETAQRLLDDLDSVDGAPLSSEEQDQLRWLRAAALENLGVACGFTGQYDRALEACRSAENAYMEVGGGADVARSRANRAVALVAVGRALDGLEAIDSAAELFDELDDRLSYAKCLGHAADAELLLGRYAAALTRYEKARQILESLEARTESCRLRLRTVRAYLALNLVDEAEGMATEVADLLEQLGLDHDLAEAQWLVAVAQLRAGRPAEAMVWLDESVAGSTLAADPPLLVKALLAKSEALADLGRGDDACAVGEQALATVHTGDWPTEALHVHLQLAQLLDENDLVGREARLDEAARLAEELGLPHLRFPVLLQLGRLRRDQGRDDEARQSWEQAVEVVESLRGLIPDEALRTSYLDGRTAAHAELIALLIDGDLCDQHAAFDLAEASKARSLSDLLAGVLQPATVSRYEADLDAAYSALCAGGSAMSSERRLAVRRRAEELEQELKISQLRLGSDAESVTPPMARSRVRRQPGAQDQVIEYHVIADRLVAFVWSRGELRIVDDLAPVHQVDQLLQNWDRQRQRFLVGTRIDSGHATALTASADQLLEELWMALFAGVEQHLDRSVSDLVVVPHGSVHQVPFHALIGEYGRVSERWTITVAPSFAVAESLRDRAPSPASGRYLVMGAPDDAAPAVADEAEFVAGILPNAELKLGDEATSDALVEGCAERDVIHLACHGIHRSRNPMFSALRLADRWFTARDVMSLRLQDSLVVLSACESGRQSGPGALDEAVGLARSFVAAGAGAVVVSLWLAGDSVTFELMRHFYRYLDLEASSAAGRLPAQALTRAQTAIAERHPHPAEWAPFIVHGGL